ncbi:MAG: glycosyltransferase [Bacteroidetes bacterium]|nr:MAG: glycosyltransferase [Bacteroidota bacterium]
MLLPFLLILYFAFAAFLLVGFKRRKTVVNGTGEAFTVLIPFRNEGEVIAKTSKAVIERLISSPYEFEVIWINDGSEDQSVDLVRANLPTNDNRFRISNTSGVGKKAAIELGYRTSSHPVILTIDADVIPQAGWPKGMINPFSDKSTQMVCGDVFVLQDGGVQSSFEGIDTLSLVGSARGLTQNGWAVMCNGANLAYRKMAFEKIGGFGQHAHISSGDDVFTLQRMMAHYPDGVLFADIQELSGVYTYPQQSWKAVFRQRIRWAGKSSSYTSAKAKAVAGLIAFLSLSTVVGLVGSIFSSSMLVPVLILWMGKAMVDVVLLKRFSRAYKYELPFGGMVVQSLVYPFYTAVIVVLSFFVKVEWKGRKIAA